MLRIYLFICALALVACTSQPSPGIRFNGSSQLHALGELASCTAPVTAKSIDPAVPTVVLVHGCNASQGRFRALSELFELHGQQTLCFRYDDRRRLGDVARELNGALTSLAARLERSELTVLGHSQGGLVARAAVALADEHPLHTRSGPLELSLVTISTPFNGIEAAADCGAKWLHVVTLGGTLAVCRAIAGAKWRDIHPHAQMVREPGRLFTQVSSHLEIRTDERNTCRVRGADGRCALPDYVFSVTEQRNQRVDDDRRVTPELVAAGHAEIVGKDGAPPHKLLAVLQRRGVLGATPAHKQVALQELLKRLF
jgi:pimeloyl-ACP methyl ester carboxylesterase